MSGFTLKIIALVLMILEHFTDFYSEAFSWVEDIDLYAHYSGRIVAPLFFFLTVEGFFKTRSRQRYIFRMGLWMIITSIMGFLSIVIVSLIFDRSLEVLLGNRPLVFSILSPLGKNIFASILVGLLLLYCFEKIKGTQGLTKLYYVMAMVFLALIGMFTEASLDGLVLYVLFYLCYQKPKKLFYGYIIIFLFQFLTLLIPTSDAPLSVTLTVNYQYLQILALPFIMLYNGSRGVMSLKYFFYMIYPLHLCLLYISSFFFK